MGRINYRKIYEKFNGPIPLDEFGRTYEIHHKDGNPENNDPENLLALTIKEHYEVHFKQEDWRACALITLHFQISPEERTFFARKIQQTLLQNGNHNFQKMTKERRREISKYSGSKSRDMKVGIHAINNITRKENGRYGGLISKQNKAGFHDPIKTGGVFVKGTYWWTNVTTGEKVRKKECPGQEWKRGMKI